MVQPTILCVDDDPDDRYLLTKAIQQMAPDIGIAEAENGRAALDWLQRAKTTRSLPCLVLLDINMPVMDGRQTLENMQRDTDLHNVRVVIFTSSERPADRQFFNSHGIELVVKPSSYQLFGAAIARFVHAYCA